MRYCQYILLFLFILKINISLAAPFGCLNIHPATKQMLVSVSMLSVIKNNDTYAELMPYEIYTANKQKLMGWELKPMLGESFILKCLYKDNLITSENIPKNFNTCAYTNNLQNINPEASKYRVVCYKN